MSIKQIRLSQQARDQLIRLKTRTGIPHWNTLCRWAFCMSLRERTPPTQIDVPADSNVEMSWHVFGGEYHDICMASLKERCVRDGLQCSDQEADNQRLEAATA
jgi:DNA sulfur modification protein DndE